MTSSAGSPPAPPAVDMRGALDAAANWLVLLSSGSATEHDHAAFRRWRSADPAHAAAWARAEHVLGALHSLPPDTARAKLGNRSAATRRAALGKLAALLAVPAGGWLAWRMLPTDAWTADLRTAVGERRTVHLADGSRLLLNTDSAVDIRFDATQRLLVLHAGEILVQTAADPAPVPRPFEVQTPHGRIRALGTRFSVRQHASHASVAVAQHAVALRPASGAPEVRLEAGQTARLTAWSVVDQAPASPTQMAWTRGMLAVDGMALADVLAEFGRYRRGVLRCDPAIAGLRISGVYPLDDIDGSLALIAASFGLRLRGAGGFWVRLDAA